MATDKYRVPIFQATFTVGPLFRSLPCDACEAPKAVARCTAPVGAGTVSVFLCERCAEQAIGERE